MQANQLLTADMLDIIFDGKNKEYGAYNLRRTYDTRLLKSMLTMISLLALLISSYFVYANRKVDKEVIFSPVITLDPTTIADAHVEPPPPPKPLAASPTHVRSESFTAIQIVKADVPDDVKPPTVTDLENARISTIKTDGIEDAGLTGPNSNVIGVGTGVVSAPGTKGNGTDEKGNGFIPIEIESQYPGGLTAWRRFLDRSLGNNYPPEAEEKKIQGTVIIQFIVDADGKVSNVEAISGPEELRDAAVTVIKRSGKWDPAIQNGTKVKSYKKQPITFRIFDQDN